MTNSAITTAIIDGRLKLDVARGDVTKGFDLALPADMKAIDAACEVLMMNLAGVSKAELLVTAMTAIMESEPAHGK